MLTHSFTNFFDGRNSGALVVGTLPPEVHKDVVHHSLLQGCHVAVRKKSIVKFTEEFSPSTAADYNQAVLHPRSQIQGKNIPDPDPHQRIKFKYFYPKKLFLSSRKYDRDVHPGSGF